VGAALVFCVGVWCVVWGVCVCVCVCLCVCVFVCVVGSKSTCANVELQVHRSDLKPHIALGLKHRRTPLKETLFCSQACNTLDHLWKSRANRGTDDPKKQTKKKGTTSSVACQRKETKRKTKKERKKRREKERKKEKEREREREREESSYLVGQPDATGNTDEACRMIIMT